MYRDSFLERLQPGETAGGEEKVVEKNQGTSGAGAQVRLFDNDDDSDYRGS